MTQAASTVVEAHALNSWSAWNPQHTMIYTYTRLQVTNTLKGSPESYILVKQIGGVRRATPNALRASGHCSPAKTQCYSFTRTRRSQELMLLWA